jgi:hypothetical protein
MGEICRYGLLEGHRKLQWILKHIMWLAPTGSAKKKDAAFELCLTRDLCLCVDRKLINDLDAVTGETALISLCANGGNVDDIELLVAAGADLQTRSRGGKLAVDMASEHGHDRCVGRRARALCSAAHEVPHSAESCTRCATWSATSRLQEASQST